MNSNNLWAVMQPTYIPWVGYFDMIDQVDKFVFLDDVQLEKSSWQTRNRIKTSQGELFLSISRKNKKNTETLPLIRDVELDESSRWREKHTKTIELTYKKTAFFDEVFPVVSSLINNNFLKLAQFNINIITELANKLGIKTDFIVSSEIPGVVGEKDERVVAICKYLDCSAYLSPVGAAQYIELNNPGGEFSKNKIPLYYHNYEHPRYTQLYGAFIPYMSIIDLLFNEGFKNSLDIIKEGRRRSFDYQTYNKLK